jgi:uncharacterized protein with HEPN domain
MIQGHFCWMSRRPLERCEALSQLRRRDEHALAFIPEHTQIIGLRNILIHEYGKIDDELVWKAVQQQLPLLLSSVTGELDRTGR